MRILSWNCRGLGNSPTIRQGKKLALEWNPDFLFLMETKLQAGKGTQILSRWGFDEAMEVERVGLSGGLALGWHTGIQVSITFKTQHLVHAAVIDHRGDTYAITFIYGHPVLAQRIKIWEELERIGTLVNSKWLCIGDFNQVLSEDDKLSFKDSSLSGNLDLLQTISTLSLMPIEAKGLPYTWMNKRNGDQFVMEKLDRAFGNMAWLDCYPHCLVRNLPIIASDHGPIILDSDCTPPPPPHSDIGHSDLNGCGLLIRIVLQL
jgi:exonuclease III